MKNSKPVLFRPALAALAAGALLISGLQWATAQQGRDLRAQRRPHVYEGISRRGSFQEALDDAVGKALRALPGADRMVRYRVQEITGKHGGIAAMNVVRVSIEVTDRAGAAPPAGNPDPPANRPLRAELEVMPAQVGQRGSVTFQLNVRNTGDQAQVLNFPTAQQMEFEVRRNGQPVWRWSDGKVFAQVLKSMTLTHNQAVTLTGRWELKNRAGEAVSPGRYQVTGWLTAQGQNPRVAAEGTLTVTER